MTMKKRRHSPDHGSDQQSPWASIGDFADIFFKILMTLSTQSIVICLAVCKGWHDRIASREFATFHSKRAKPQFLFQDIDMTASRTFFLLEPEHYSHGFDLENCRCEHLEIRQKCHIEVNSAMKISLNEGLPAERESSFLQLYHKDRIFRVVNSCHGLVCLADTVLNNPVFIGNPLTGDYINLPMTTPSDYDYSFMDCGLGFDVESKKYKVVRAFNTGTYANNVMKCDSLAEIHTVGTDSWRSLEVPFRSWYKFAFPTYLDGFLYGFRIVGQVSKSLMSFNFKDEKFRHVTLPHVMKVDNDVSMVVLKGDLCISDSSEQGALYVWKLENNSGSWIRLFTLNLESPRGLNIPINYFENGDLIVLCLYTQELIYCNEENGTRKMLRRNGNKARFEAITFTPSFIALKDIVAVDNVEVLKNYSRFGQFKVAGDTPALYLEGILHHKELGELDYDDEVSKWNKHLWIR